MKIEIRKTVDSYQKFNPLGLNIIDVFKVVNAPETRMNTRLFGKLITINSPFWYLHGLDELFVDEVYRFECGQDNPRIIDCGANIGLSVLYFKRLYPQSVITAFEPDKSIFNILESNVLAFGFSDVELINKAVWNEDCPIRFVASGGVGGRIQKIQNNDKVSELPATRLKNFLEHKVDFLKIDIEGAEFDVIDDCKESLNNVSNIFIEYHSEKNREQKLDDILKILKEAGFKYYLKEAWVNQSLPYVNKRQNLFDLQLNIFGYRID